MQSIIAKDSGLTGLSLVFNREQVAHTLASANLLAHDQSVELEYIRYKPRRRALGLFSLVDSSGSKQALVVQAYDAGGWQKFLQTGHADDVQSKHGLVLPNHCSSLEWFPFDRRLKQLAKLTDPARNETVFRRLLGTSTDDGSLCEGPAWTLEPLTYKPARRFVARATRGSSSIAIKCYTRDDFEWAQFKSQAVNHELMANLVSRTVASSARYCMTASEWLSGETLTETLATQSHSPVLLESAGKLLFQWQTLASQCLRQITMPHPGFTLQSLRTIVEDVSWLLPDIRRPLEKVVLELTESLAALALGQDLIHGDFYAKQILVHQGELKLIDFDELGRGHHYQDLGNFVGHLYWDAIRDDRSSSSDLSQLESNTGSLLAGYESLAGTLDDKLIRASIAIGIVRCLAHAFRRGLPDWPERMRQLLACAQRYSAACRNSQRGLISRDRLSTADQAVPISFQQLKVSDQVSDISAEYHSECLPYVDVPTINAQWRDAGNFISPSWNETDIVNARLIRHKPGKRLLVEYVLAPADGCNEVTVIGKARMGKRIAPDLLSLHDELQALRSNGVIVPRVVGQLLSMNLWFQEKIAGQHVLFDSNPSHQRVVGAALAQLHLSGVNLDRTHTVDDELRILRQQYQQWLLGTENWRNSATLLLELADRSVATLEPVDHVLVHRDFYFDQVLVTPYAVAILDFDLACMGPAELDVGNYLAHLDEYYWRHSLDDHANQASAEFLTGYREIRSDLCLTNVDVWYNLSLARLAAISQRIPSRAGTTERLLDRCIERFHSSLAVVAK